MGKPEIPRGTLAALTWKTKGATNARQRDRIKEVDAQAWHQKHKAEGMATLKVAEMTDDGLAFWVAGRRDSAHVPAELLGAPGPRPESRLACVEGSKGTQTHNLASKFCGQLLPEAYPSPAVPLGRNPHPRANQCLRG